MKPRIMAFYLPQFHAIPENDQWWGKGFTDWVNVKKARPLFKGHLQPKLPLDENYYDLSKKETLYWQAELAQKYGVYGFCFYHYWFDGKLLLEKPAELLLQNADINIRYCFSWANEPWARTWDGKAHHVLMPQCYGDKESWKNHFDYLLPFFKDTRYIKEDNCPMFLIYKSQSIEQLPEMMSCWNRWAKEAGFNGIHLVETLGSAEVDKRDLPFKTMVEFEPVRCNMQQSFISLNYKRLRRRCIHLLNCIFQQSIALHRPFSFEEVAKRSVRCHSPKGTYAGAFVGWDNTPRRQLAGTIILPPSKEQFKQYLKNKIEQTRNVYHTNYVFINAWNEWAEGTVLEPSQSDNYKYLEAISELMNEYSDAFR